ncbi:hypothetical protein JCM19238_701 [Vibrio ponticus]|nr:hypothetical protein JCM19238_701 [Vibrio ponticus]
MPSLFSLVYIFVVPMIQWTIDIAKYKLIEKRRATTANKQLLEKYQGQTRVAEQQSKTSQEYWQELHRNHAENAGKYIVNLKSLVSFKTDELRERSLQLKSEQVNYSKLESMNHNMSAELSDLREQLKKLSDELSESKRQEVIGFDLLSRVSPIIQKQLHSSVEEQNAKLYWDEAKEKADAIMQSLRNKYRNDGEIYNSTALASQEFQSVLNNSYNKMNHQLDLIKMSLKNCPTKFLVLYQ